MTNNFTTSINILRDSERSFSYIPTPNAKQVVSQIVNDFKKGIRSFNVVGTYGTGKSSFLLAFEQSILGTKHFFEPNFLENPKVEFIKIIGSFTSIIDCFSDLFSISDVQNKHERIFSEISNRYLSIGNEKKVLFILIDEFGKFLEFASKHNPENELYFVQQLAEFCNNINHNIVLITTVHQSLESYAYTLTNQQKQEWIKVKGRFREITFNEPVEQLLFLASEHISDNINLKIDKNIYEECLKLIIKTKAFNFNNTLINEVALKLFPLDLLAAFTLTLSLQRYGQNERSLFSFLESTDHTGFSKFNQNESPFYNVANVYDYLIFNYYSFLTSKYNPDFSAWCSIRTSIETVERTFENSINDYIKAVKVIGLLNIFSASGSRIDHEFLTGYLKVACGLINSQVVLKNLENKNIVRFRSHNKRFILFEGTDLNIETAIIEAGNKISAIGDITSLLSKHISFNPVFANQYSYEFGTPRYLDFVISEFPIDKIPKDEIDGYVNLVFNEKIESSEIKKKSLNQEEAIIYCFFNNAKEIKNLLFEIEKVQKVIDDNKEDKIAKRELENICESQTSLLKRYITENIYSENDDVQWFFKGKELGIKNKRDFNKLLSRVCSLIYSATPTFKNELVNKHKISTSIHSAKRNYFRALSNNWNVENLGFDEDKFPPEKTIYLTLLKENNISPFREDDSNILSISESSSFYPLWLASEAFLNSAKVEQVKISELTSLLIKRPFKLKKGLIDLWVPSFLFLKRDDFAIFGEGNYIPNLSEENLELIAKYPEKYTIKTFDIEGVKLDIFNRYRKFLDQKLDVKFDNNSFIETIKPFIIFYKQLPEYSKNTKRLSKPALKIREAIAKSKNPEVTFFDDFPSALGLTLNTLQEQPSKLQTFTNELKSSVKEIRTAFDELINRFEQYICTEFIGEIADFETYKGILQKRFINLKKHLLLSQQKTFIQRLDSSIDDKKAWLTSLAQVVTGRALDLFSDEDEILLYEKFKSMIFELDSLTKISISDIDENKEEIIGVKIDSFFGKIDPKVVRIPKNKMEEIERLKSELKNMLGSDKTSNIAAVINLLKELLK